jgi:hypothetical protein
MAKRQPEAEGGKDERRQAQDDEPHGRPFDIAPDFNSLRTGGFGRRSAGRAVNGAAGRALNGGSAVQDEVAYGDQGRDRAEEEAED